MNLRRISIGVLCLVLFTCFAIPRAGAQQAPAMKAAADLFNQSKWPEAAHAYREIAAADPNNGAAWTNLGECLLQQHKQAEALDAYGHAIKASYRPLINQVNEARAYADAHDKAKALATLQQVADSGSGARMRPFVLGSTEFTELKDDPDFQKILGQMRPCVSANYRQFDFWVGDWDVQVQGQSAGHNTVTLEQEGCLLVEHWKALTGGQTGTSFNYYDVRDKKWHQLYLDNSGNAGAFPAMSGNLTGNKMVLMTDPSVSPVSRWTWYVVEPGKVRQMAEVSSDGQKTWSTTWDSIYVKASSK